MSKFVMNQVVMIDGNTIGTIKELPSGYDHRYMVEIGYDLRRIDIIRITASRPGNGSIKKDEKRNG